MDIRAWAQAIWRFKWISLGGFVLACLLAVLATARLSFNGGPKLTYRTPVIYTTQSKIFVTQAGFPMGRTVLPTSPTASGDSSPAYADPSRFVMLAGVYATLVNSDRIQAALVHPRDRETLTAVAEVNTQTQTPLPIIDLDTYAPSQQRASEMALKAASMLKNYVESQQRDANVPVNQRVLLQTLQQPSRVLVASGRKKTVPIVVFMTVILATIGLILALENIRPRVRLGELGELPSARADEGHESTASRIAG